MGIQAIAQSGCKDKKIQRKSRFILLFRLHDSPNQVFHFHYYNFIYSKIYSHKILHINNLTHKY